VAVNAGSARCGGAPQVSVVIPTYNRAKDLRRCLDSVVAQTFRDFEVLVCDDGSTDETAQVVGLYKGVLDLTYRWNENFGGPARPRNLGLRLARGTYVALLDSDDWWAPRKLAESVRRLDAGADLVYHDMFAVRSTRQRFHWYRHGTRALATPAFDDLLKSGNAICNSSVVVRREILLRVEGFSEDRSLIAWEDYDAWLRIARITERFAQVGETLGYYWTGGGNISSPQRIISNLERFKEIYVATGVCTSIRTPPAWYHYVLGLAYNQVGNHLAAVPHLRQALAAGLPALQQTRAVLTAAVSYLRILAGSVRGAAAKTGFR
jgi:glycosyltransferase involved in cell wall biosynthesis